MSVADLQELEEVKLLVVKGQATGVLTYAEVATALAEVELDETDERPLQSRRSFHVGRYAAVVTITDGRVTRVVEHPHDLRDVSRAASPTSWWS